MSRSLKLSSFKPLSFALAAVVCIGLSVPVNAMWAPPVEGAPVSTYFTQIRALRALLSWQAAVGWGTVGAINTIKTFVQVQKFGDIGVTKAAVQTVCGTTAAAVFGNWKPEPGPTMVANLKAIVKAAVVIGPVDVCGWITEATFKAIDRNAKAAQAAVEVGHTSVNVSTLMVDRKSAADLLNEQITSFDDYAAYNRIATGFIVKYDECINSSGGNVRTCYEPLSLYNKYKALAATEFINVKRLGLDLHNAMEKINKDINS